MNHQLNAAWHRLPIVTYTLPPPDTDLVFRDLYRAPAWVDCPPGTVAYASTPRYWTKQESGQWISCDGTVASEPGPDLCLVSLPLREAPNYCTDCRWSTAIGKRPDGKCEQRADMLLAEKLKSCAKRDVFVSDYVDREADLCRQSFRGKLYSTFFEPCIPSRVADPLQDNLLRGTGDKDPDRLMQAVLTLRRAHRKNVHCPKTGQLLGEVPCKPTAEGRRVARALIRLIRVMRDQGIRTITNSSK